MNKCCVKKIECEHATSYGVCRESSFYDCVKIPDKCCDCCNKPLLKGDTVFVGNFGGLLCEECADKLLTREDQLDSYIYEDQCKDWYLDDEILDIELFEKEEIK